MKRSLAVLFGLVFLATLPLTLSASATAPTGIALGVFQPSTSMLGFGTAVDQYTAQVGKKPAFAWFPVKWQNPVTGAYQKFDARGPDQFRKRGIMPGINWDASKGIARNPNQPDYSWKAIASGKHDTYIKQFAAASASYRYPFLIRLFVEMNGFWYPWGYNVNGNTNAADFVAAWRHVVDIFHAQGATNVQFVWCPTAMNANQLNQYGSLLTQVYPGDNYVDWVAVDGYANLDTYPQTLQDVFQPTYQFLAQLSNRPIMIYEVGAVESSTDPMAKANWITQGFLTTIPQQFPRVRAVNWFDSYNDRGDRNYQVDTSQNSLNAWKQVVASPLYQLTFGQ